MADQGAQDTVRLTHSRLLIVEGTDEREFFEQFIRRMGNDIPQIADIQILPAGGKDRLAQQFVTLRLTPGFYDDSNQVHSIGIVRDADNDPAGAFQSVCNALQRADLPAPSQPMTPVGDTLQVVVFIMPGQDAPGMLEDLCLQSVAGDPAMGCIEEYFRCLENHLPGNQLPKNYAKARLQAFLASRKETFRDLGIAAQRGGIWGGWDHAAFAGIAEFLHLLCSQSH